MTHADLPAPVDDAPPSRRGAARKLELLDATLRVIGREGLSGLSIRAVAAEAGAPLGAVNYYFSGKDELIEAAFQRHAQSETARVLQVVRRTGSVTHEQLAERLAGFVVEGMTVHRVRLQAEYEFMVESARRPALQRSATVWQQGLRTHLEAAVEALGSPSPRTDARLVLATISGLEVDSLAEEVGPAQRRAIHAVLLRLLQSLHATSTATEETP